MSSVSSDSAENRCKFRVPLHGEKSNLLEEPQGVNLYLLALLLLELPETSSLKLNEHVIRF